MPSGSSCRPNAVAWTSSQPAKAFLSIRFIRRPNGRPRSRSIRPASSARRHSRIEGGSVSYSFSDVKGSWSSARRECRNVVPLRGEPMT